MRRPNPRERAEYEKKLQSKENEELKERAMTWLEKKERAAERRGEKRGEAKGEERGKNDGKKSGLLTSIGKFWTARFGPMPEDVAKRLKAVHEPGQLERVFDAILGARDQAEALGKVAELCPAH